MNKKTIMMAIALLFGVVVSAVAAKPTPEEQQKTVAALKALAESQYYTIFVTQATPPVGSARRVSGYSVKMAGDKVFSALPYLGKAQNSFGGETGLRFDGTVSDYKIESGKKDKTIVSFTAAESTATRKYVFRIEIFPNAMVYMSVSNTNMQTMRFGGQIGVTRDSEKE